jgi:hypothetical protein
MKAIVITVILSAASLAHAQTGSTAPVADPSERTQTITKVKDYLTHAGYTDVEMKDDPDREKEHIWSGTATKGDKRVQVHVTDDGEISED